MFLSLSDSSSTRQWDGGSVGRVALICCWVIGLLVLWRGNSRAYKDKILEVGLKTDHDKPWIFKK